MTRNFPDRSTIRHALGFTIPARHARGRVVRLGPVLDEILAAHAYPPVIEALLAEALALTALLGSTLKDAGGQLTLQAQTEGGVVELLVCDYRGGELRGYVQFDADRLAEAARRPDLVRAVRQGLSRDHLRPGGDRRALSGHRAARGRERWPRRRRAISPSPSRSRASSGSAVASDDGSWSRAACCSSICPRARRGASGCTRGWTIRNGSMSRPRRDDQATRNWPTPSCRWRLALAPVPRGGRGAHCRSTVLSKGAAAARTISHRCSSASRRRSRRHGRRGRHDPRRLRILRHQLPDRDGKSRVVSVK